MAIFSETIVTECEGTIAENIKKLSAKTSSKKLFGGLDTKFAFHGKIAEESFEITPTSDMKNSFAPLMCGKFSSKENEKTTLTLKVGLKPMVKFITLAICILVVIIEAIVFLTLSIIPWQPLLVALGAILLPFVTYRIGKKAAINKLLEILNSIK